MMVPGETRTGKIFESMLVTALQKNNYSVQEQVKVGNKPDGSKYTIDILVDSLIYISIKWQQIGGSAEEKIPFEVITLTHILKTKNNENARAYIVLGGNGWRKSLKEWYCSSEFLEWILEAKKYVTIVNENTFVAMINNRQI